MKKINLLLDERPLIVLPSLAKMIGLNEAIILQQLHYWLQRSNNTKEGKRWVYKTYDEWSQEFPFFSQRTVRRTINKLETDGLVISRNYNQKGYDNTKWYTINYEHLAKLARPSGQNDQARPGQNDQTNTIDYYIPETTTDINNTSTNVDASVKTFFDYYCQVWKDIFPRGPRLTQGRIRKIKARLKTFTLEEMKTACDNLHKSPYHKGDNPDRKVYGTIDFLIRSDEQIARWLEEGQATPVTAKGGVSSGKGNDEWAAVYE